MTARARFGTSSFSTRDWVGPFYPPGTKAADYLARYAEKLDTVEIDSTYYGIPRATTIEKWVRQTPESFLLAAKFPRDIVHGGKGAKPDRNVILVPERTDDIVEEFLDVMQGLGDKLGPLVLQFPFLADDVFPSREEFYDRLDRFLERLPDGFRYAVEVRNKGLMNATVAEICRNRGACLVLVDQAWMPHADEVMRRFDPVTTDYAYVRLLGDHKEMDKLTTTWDKEVVDRTPRLRRWAEVIGNLLQREIPVFTYVNNHYAGHAPATVRRLEQFLEDWLTEHQDAAWRPEETGN